MSQIDIDEFVKMRGVISGPNLAPKEPPRDYHNRIYAPFEVIIHNTPDDCWLSFLGQVFDVTPLVKKHRGEKCIKPIMVFAGKDVSHWFNERTGDIQMFVHPITGVEVPYCPHGVIPDVPYEVPTTLWRPLEGLPWWKNNDRYQVGVLTKMVRPVRIVNMLILKEVTLNVCCEDTFLRIRERYSMFNKEAHSYTWMYLDNIVDMTKTMEDNEIQDEREQMAELGIAKNSYIPVIRIYYNDDMGHFEDLSEDEEEDIC